MINPETLDLTTLPSLPLSDRKLLPVVSCIYFAMSNGIVQYIGRSKNLQQRWMTHHHIEDLGTDSHIAWLEISTPDLLPEIEKALISWFNPALNGVKKRKKPVEKCHIAFCIDKTMKEDLIKIAKSNNRSVANFVEYLVCQEITKGKGKRLNP